MKFILLNSIVVVACSALGLVLRGKIKGKYQDAIIKGFGLFILIIGLQGAMKGSNYILYVVSIIIGAIIGFRLNIDKKFRRIAFRLALRVKSKDKEFTKGFIFSTVLFTVGAMAILGPMNSIIKGDNTILLTKSFMDGVTSIILSATYGIGVMFSAIPVLVYEGLIGFLALFAKNFLFMSTIEDITFLGNLLIVGLGLNILGVTKIKVMNYVPIIFIPIVFQFAGQIIKIIFN